LLLATLAQAQPLGGRGGRVITQRATIASLQDAGFNIDLKNVIDPICGLVIEWPLPKPPVSFYNGSRNPWGAPTMTPVGNPPTKWILTFGGPNGPCFSKSDPIFYESGTFLGPHFGFYTKIPLGRFLTFPCWMIAENNERIPCSGITGKSFGQDRLDVHNNSATHGFSMQNVAVAASPNPIPINDLNRLNLAELDWRPVALANSFLPAGGTLTLQIPTDLQSGFAVFSYDIADPLTHEVYASETVEIAIEN
ncbi:MAG TPA: hypothetical protein VF179_14465, partial [Thermoanaerobaculia bacterium]|nr:hypothetical protein [Thermoanaerobaculia bacterium]